METTEIGSAITSTIIRRYEQKIYLVAYKIKTNRNWETIFFEINCQHGEHNQLIQFEGDGKGNWVSNGKKADQCLGYIDVDIPSTPLTNTLPICRLKLTKNQAQETQAICCNLFEKQIKPVRQKYTCLSDVEYHYENVPNDFEAITQVDESGLIIDYPSLFFRTAAIKANYR